MKRREVSIKVSDHAVLRWLEREHGLDLEAVRALITGLVTDGATLGAVSVVNGRVRFVLRENERQEDGAVPVVVVTTLRRDQRRGVGVSNGRGGRRGRHD